MTIIPYPQTKTLKTFREVPVGDLFRLQIAAVYMVKVDSFSAFPIGQLPKRRRAIREARVLQAVSPNASVYHYPKAEVRPGLPAYA